MVEECEKCNVFDISQIVQTKSALNQVHCKRNLVARTSDKVNMGHSASALRSKGLINDIVLELLLNREFYKANLLVFNINTGFRNGDTQSFRVKDLTNANGTIKDFITLKEDKTDKLRTIWLNETVKKMLKFTIAFKQLKPNNYIFRGDGNRVSYIDHIIYIDHRVYDEQDNIVDIVTTLDEYDNDGVMREVYDVVMVGKLKDKSIPTGASKYNADGTLKEIAPMLVGSVTRWLKALCAQFGIAGKYSSHTFRQTYAYFISQNWVDNRDIQVVCSDFGHSNSRITLEHYNGIDSEELKKHQLSLNLGGEAVDMFMKEEIVKW